MESLEGVYRPLNEILTIEELTLVPNPIKSKLETVLNEIQNDLHSARTILSQERVANSQHTYQLDVTISNLNTKLGEIEEDVDKLRTSKKNLESEVISLRGEKERLGNELERTKLTLSATEDKLRHGTESNAELLIVLGKRNGEIDKLTKNLEGLTERLEKANNAKIEAMGKMDELMGKEVEIKIRESHLSQQSQSLQAQVSLLESELNRKSMDLLNAQRDSSIKYIHTQSELSQKIEELKITEIKLADLKELYENSEKQIESLMDKLKNESNVRGKIEENYRVEINSLKRVVELYKESSVDSSHRVEELESAVSSLQDLLRESTDKYGQLESRFAQTAKEFQDEITKRDESIGKLKLELKTANEVLDGIQKAGMSEDVIKSLSPAAAAASQLFREANSITEIFSKYQELQLELNRVKCDNLKLNGYIREILDDIESRAPLLQSQKHEYERALQTVHVLSSQVEVGTDESTKLKTMIVELKKNLSISTRQNTRYQIQLEDLSRQVRSLLSEVARHNNNEDVSGALVPMSMSASDVISHELTTFSSITELHQQNMKLRALVRDLSEQREQGERDQQEENLREITRNFDKALEELQELKEIRLRQDDRMKEIQVQRDTLNNLLSRRHGNGSISLDDSETSLAYEKLKTMEEKLSRVQQEFETYKIEKRENERILNETAEKLREEVLRVRTDNARLGGQVEYNNERAKIYGKNLEQYKKQIGLLEERNRGLNEIIGRHEGSIEQLKTELSNVNSSLSRSEVAISTLTNERNSLREAKNRLQLEVSMLQRHNNLTSTLQSNIEQIKNNLEMNATATKIKLENEIESLKSENGILKRRIESENERGKESLVTGEIKFEQMKEKYEKEKEKCTKIEIEMEEREKRIVALIGEIDSLKKASERENKEEGGTSLSTQQEVDNSVELITLKTELSSLRTQLEVSRSSAQEYKNLSEAMESQLTIAQELNKTLNIEFEGKLNQKDARIITMETELNNVGREFENYKRETEIKLNDLHRLIQEREGMVNQIRFEFDSEKERFMKNEQELERMRSDLHQQVRMYEDVRNNFERESILRGESAQEILRLKNEIERVRNNLENEEKVKTKVEEALNFKEQELASLREQHDHELEGLKTDLASYKSACDRLEQQLTEALEAGNMNMNISQSEDTALSSSQNSEQWLQLIKFLRREKEIAISKMEAGLAEGERLKVELDQIKKNYEETKAELEKLVEKESVGLLTSVKQSELMRKVETLSAIGDSNRLLREQNQSLLSKLSSLEIQLATIETHTITPLKLQLQQLQSSNDQLSIANTTLTESTQRWQKRANELIEKTNKVNPEEMKRLQTENETLLKTKSENEQEMKRLESEIEKMDKVISEGQKNMGTLRTEIQHLRGEKSKADTETKTFRDLEMSLKADVERLRAQVSNMKKEIDFKESEVERLKGEHGRLEAAVDEHKNTVKQVKNIARKYKKQFEDLSASVASQESLGENPVEMGVKITQLEQEKTSHEQEMSQQEEKLSQLRTEHDQTLNLLQSEQVEKAQLKSELEMVKQRLHLIEKMTQKKEGRKLDEEHDDGKRTASIKPISVKEPQKVVAVTAAQQQQQLNMNVVQPMQQQSQQVSSTRSVVTITPQQLQLPEPVSQSQTLEEPTIIIEPRSIEQVSSSAVVVPPVGGNDNDGDGVNEGASSSRSITKKKSRTEMEQQEEEGEVVSQQEDEEDEGPVTKRGRSEQDFVEEEEDVDEGEEEEEPEGVEEEEEQEHHEDHDEDEDDEEEEEDGDEGDDDDDNEREAIPSTQHEYGQDEHDVVDVPDSDDEHEEDEEQMEMGDEEDEQIEEGRAISSTNMPTSSFVPQQQMAFSSMMSTPTITIEDASIVPSTPTLFRRSMNPDGFSEVTTASTTAARFTFEDTSVSGGRSVPSTPAPEGMLGEHREEGEDEEEDEEDNDVQIVEHDEGGHEEDEGTVPSMTTITPTQPSTTSTTTTASAEVPSSSTTTLSTLEGGLGMHHQPKPKPTPIVWDQPSSSSMTTIAPGLGGPGRGIPRGFTTPRRTMYHRGGSGAAVSSTFNPRVLSPLIRGPTGPRAQSARRSRPGGYYRPPVGRGGGPLL